MKQAKRHADVLKLIFCQFCGLSSHSQYAADQFIVGRRDRVCICSDCVEICNQIIAEHREKKAAQSSQDAEPQQVGAALGAQEAP